MKKILRQYFYFVNNIDGKPVNFGGGTVFIGIIGFWFFIPVGIIAICCSKIAKLIKN